VTRESKTPAAQRPAIVLTVRDEWPDCESSFDVRLRIALKHLLRRFGTRCVSLRPVKVEKEAPTR